MVIERWAAGFASVTRVFKDNCAFAASDAVTSPSVGLKLVKVQLKVTIIDKYHILISVSSLLLLRSFCSCE